MLLSPHLVRRMSIYIHERRDWPRFRWNDGRLAGRLAAVRHQQGRLIGRMEALGFSVSAEAVLHTLPRDWIGSWAA
jgi:Fic family protein